MPSRGTSSCPQHGTHCRPNAPARARAPPTPGSWPCCKDCTLPLRTTIDRLRRDLLVGEPGRLYSELAASWLGVMAVSRIVLVVLHRRRVGRGRRARVTLVPRPGEANAYRRARSCHPATGVWLALDFLFLAASGLTWSANAGENVSQLCSALHWTAPKVSTALPGSAQRQGVGDEHAEHRGRGFRPRTPARCAAQRTAMGVAPAARGGSRRGVVRAAAGHLARGVARGGSRGRRRRTTPLGPGIRALIIRADGAPRTGRTA
ncbi:PepSY domain-containing protein [Kocuria indica]|nr:PepSY domain-containing protein [Kocuria indica]MBN6810667.1 PepSY domain-containing protein [Kocuria indica]MBN6842705.1 PepSY domain-containing protein [Kocuria indica]